MNKKVIVIGLVAVLVAGGGAGAWWYNANQKPHDKAAVHEEAKKEKAGKPTKFVTLDKVIVMLRRSPGDNATHYLSTDLVLATTDEHEKHTKEHLPLLRSIAVRALSAHTMAEASAMTVEQTAEQLNKTFDASYVKDERDKPFSEVMIGKLIIE